MNNQKKLFLALALGTAAALAAPYEAQAFCAAGDRSCMGQSAGSASGGAFSSGLGFPQGSTGGMAASSLAPAILTSWQQVVTILTSRGVKAIDIANAFRTGGVAGVERLFQSRLGITVILDYGAEVGALSWTMMEIAAATVTAIAAPFTGLVYRLSVQPYYGRPPQRAM